MEPKKTLEQKVELLPASTEVYVQSVGKKSTDYILQGFQAFTQITDSGHAVISKDTKEYPTLVDYFRSIIPSEAEVVTDYNIRIDGRNSAFAQGTVLIPKKK